jgi:hypothetical protein
VVTSSQGIAKINRINNTFASVRTICLHTRLHKATCAGSMANVLVQSQETPNSSRHDFSTHMGF